MLSNNHHCGLLLKAILSLLVIYLSAAARAQEIALDFTPVPAEHGSEVRFYAKPSGTVSVASLSNASLVPSLRTDHGFVVEVDNASYQQDKNHRFALDMYVTLKPDDPNADLYKFSVWEDEAGTFSDRWANVTVKVATHNNTDSTTVRLPIHCRDSDNLQLLVDKAVPISMGREDTPTLNIKDVLSDLHVSITGVKSITVEDRNCPKCWISHTGSPGRSDLSPGSSTTLDLDLQPDTVRILKQNLLPPPADAPPYQLTVTVLSTAELGGPEVSQEFHVPIRFTPAPRFLALSLALGIVVGLAMRALITRKVDWLDFAFQVLLALVVWLLLLFTKIKASVLGYELDPTSLVTAGLITLLVAGGSSVGSKIAEAIRKP